MEKIIVLPSAPIKKRTISQERLVRILIMEQMPEEERAAVIAPSRRAGPSSPANIARVFSPGGWSWCEIVQEGSYFVSFRKSRLSGLGRTV